VVKGIKVGRGLAQKKLVLGCCESQLLDEVQDLLELLKVKNRLNIRECEADFEAIHLV
jgi:hypothetical protein